MRQNKNLMDINIDALYNILKQNQGDVNDSMGSKKKNVVVTSDPLALIAEKTKSYDKKVEKKTDEKKRDMSRVKCYNYKKEGHFAKDCKKAKSTCFVRNEDGLDLLTGDRSSNLYIIALNKVALNSLTCLLAKASSSQTWLWHQCLSHLNFATINNLVKNNLVQGLPKMKFEKYHLCYACEQGTIHWKHHKSKTAFASNKPLYLLHMDLCGPMRVESINRKRYVLVVVDDYSRYTWVFFLHSKDEASDVIISFIKKTQVNLQLQVQRVRTDNGMEFKNKTLTKFFEEVGFTQQFSAARTPQQNGVVERRNRTLVEAARTMITLANLPLFHWAEANATTCFTQNHSIIHKRFDKTPYELINKRKLKSSSFVCSDVDVIFSMTMRMLESSRRKGIVECLLDTQKNMASKQFSLESGLTNLNETGKSSNPSIS
nr:hypothetical protein [Tanacetum cinerariifolium]GFB10963.1 hypothetical protein [Tanacetum cinerariifolium]